jgi:hypothetical protein
LTEQIQGYVRSGIPAMVAEGTKLANEWRDRINVVTPYTTPDGRVYVGNEYKGWTLSKLPAKPTIEKFQYDVGGVKGEEPKQLIYDAQGRPTYRTIPTQNEAPATGGAIDDPFPVNGSVPEKAAWADRHNIRQAGEKKAAEEREGVIGKTVGDNQSDYIKGFKPSREAIANIDSMQEALKSLPNPAAGPLSHYYSGIARTIKELTGVEVPGTTEGQIIEKGGTMLAIHTAKELTSRPTQFDFKATMEKANPNLFQTKEGIGYLLNIQRQQHFQNVELSRLAESTPSKDWPKARDQYYKEHPLVSPLTGKEWTRDVASEDAHGIAQSGTTSAYQIGQQAKNPNTGQTMIYTPNGWVAK